MNDPISRYISQFPPTTKVKLESMRKCIRTVVPEGEELINYGMPTVKINGRNLVHFAGYAHHIGFYPGPEAIKAFEKDLKLYKTSKGAIQFPIEKHLPLLLVKKIVRFRVKKEQARLLLTAAKKKPSTDFLAQLSAPACRALVGKNITTLQRLSEFSETEILALHGMGPSSIPKLKQALKAAGLKFR
jgi:uncharacterized protein YdhG (YjbR/CyaY superfamily)